MDKEDILECSFIAFSMIAIGWLFYKYTGTGNGQISPDFWKGVFVTGLFMPMARKVLSLKKDKP